MGEVAVTYEALFEILRREKDKEELQKLDMDFFKNLASYIREKQDILTKKGLDMFSEGEKEKAEKQLLNIKKIIQEIYSRRERKIISMAVDKVRVGGIIDTSCLLDEERAFYEELIKVLEKGRESLVNALKAEQVEEAEEPKALKTTTKMVRFLSAVPKFVDQDLNVLGPFEADDMASLPVEIADILISKGRAEELK